MQHLRYYASWPTELVVLLLSPRFSFVCWQSAAKVFFQILVFLVMFVKLVSKFHNFFPLAARSSNWKNKRLLSARLFTYYIHVYSDAKPVSMSASVKIKFIRLLKSDKNSINNVSWGDFL